MPELSSCCIDGFKVYTDQENPELNRLGIAKDYVCKSLLMGELGLLVDFCVAK